MSRDLVQNLLLSAAAVASLFLAFEVVARLLGVRWSPTLMLGPETCTERSEVLGLQFRPSCSGILSDTPFTTNAARLRGPELRHNGARRILAIGDSCTWGYQVRDAESYPAVLARRLDGSAAGRWEVLNAGFPGYTSYQGLLYLRTRGRRFEPAVVIAGFGFNDTIPSSDIAAQLRQARRLGRMLDVDHWLLVHSRVYQWTRFHTSRPNAPGQLPRVSAARYERHLRRIAVLARRHDAVPILVSFWRPRTLGDYAEVPRKVARELDVPLIVYDGPRMDIVHPTADGHAQLAARIEAIVTGGGSPSR